MSPEQFISNFFGIENPIKGVRLPTITFEERHRKELKLPPTASNADFLRALCLKGFATLNFKKDSAQYKEYAARVKYELDILNELGFVDYILLVWDAMNFCKEKSIPVGPGRGSAAGSLVLFLIGITKIDSIKHGLFFERFVSKSRAKKTVIDGITYLDGTLVPDCDLDFDFYRRHEVLEYLKKKYAGKTCKILTLTTLSSKLCIKEVGKVLGMKTEEEMTSVTTMIPKRHGIVEDFSVAYNDVPDFKNWCDENKLVYETALKLADLIKNKACHASGILVSFDKLEDCCPTETIHDKESDTRELISSYDMNWVSLFSVKLDVLGLRGVSVVDDCCKSLGIKQEDIDVNDPIIYQNLQHLDNPHGLFQIEADTANNVTKKVKPKNIDEISAVLAIARPGALQFADKFATYSNTGISDSIHPFFDSVLHDTGGLCLYQEQAMKMANKIGFNLDESEQLRRAIGKKDTVKIKDWEKKIKDKIIENNHPKEIGDVFWKVVSDSAGYQFNRSHSFAYATLCAQTIYLKFKYPIQFYLSLLKMTKHESQSINQISIIHREMLSLGIPLFAPSLTMSKMDFSQEQDGIRFGLSSIKGISDKVMEKLNNFKRQNANKFELFCSAKEAGLGIGILSALIQAGCLDSISQNRVFLVYEAQLWNILTDKEKKYVSNYAKDYNNSIPATVKALVNIIKDEKSKPIIKQSRFETIKKHSEKYKLIYNQNNICQDFANLFYMTKLIGFTNGKRLIDIFLPKMSSLEPINTIKTYPEKTKCDFIGVIKEVKTGKSKNGNAYAKFLIADETSIIKSMIFKDKLEQCKSLNTKLPKEEDVVIVRGTKMSEDMVFADSIACQQNKIYDKLSDLKDATEI